MVERILEQMDDLRNVLSEDRASAHLSPSWQDQDVLLSIVNALKGLKTMMDALAAEKCVTVSAVRPLLMEEVRVAEGDDTDLTKEMKKRMKEDLQASYGDPEFSFLFELSSFLDPGFKNYVCEQ